MGIWFNSSSTETEILTFLKDVGEADFDDLVEAIFGNRPRDCETPEALELDKKASSFFQAMSQLLQAGYVSSKPNREVKRIVFRLRSHEETEILLRECRGND